MTFAPAIKEARIQAGINQYELADKLGVNQSHISMWETGKAQPSLKNWVRLEQVLGVDFLVKMRNRKSNVNVEFPIPYPTKVEFWDDIDLMGFTILTCTIFGEDGKTLSKTLGGSMLLESTRNEFKTWFAAATGIDYESFLNYKN